MSLYKQFKMDAKKETEGVPITYGANEDGTIPTFHVRRRSSTNQQYTKALTRETAPYKRMLALGTLDDKISDRLVMRVFCQSILVGWENVQNEKNEVIPFTFDNAMSIFQQLPELYEDLQAQSAQMSLFKDDSLERDAKNS